MAIFLYGWRRKAGLVTLIIASTLCLFWVRSYQRIEGVTFPVSRISFDVYVSGGRVQILKWDRRLSWSFYSAKIMKWSGPRDWKYGFPCWYVVVPPTLLSAFLLFIKPRAAIENTIPKRDSVTDT